MDERPVSFAMDTSRTSSPWTYDKGGDLDLVLRPKDMDAVGDVLRRRTEAHVFEQKKGGHSRQPRMHAAADHHGPGNAMNHGPGNAVKHRKSVARRSSTDFNAAAKSVARRSSTDFNTAARQAVEEIVIVEVNDVASRLLGSVVRHSITGRCYMYDFDANMDFQLVDLMVRPKRYKTNFTVDSIINDRYFFMPKPLVARTWIYHELSRADKAGEFDISKPEEEILGDLNFMLAFAMLAKVIDSSRLGSYGAWSPAQMYAPMVFIAAFTSNMLLMIVILITFSLSLAASSYFNNWRHYRLARFSTMIIRWPTTYVSASNFLDFSNMMKAGKTLAVAALFICLILHFIDIIADLALIYSREDEGSLEVIRLLPGKVMVCRWTSGKAAKNVVRREHYPPVTGQPGTENVVLVAEIHGMLVELVPISNQNASILRSTIVRGSRTEINLYCTESYTDEKNDAKFFDENGQAITSAYGDEARKIAVKQQLRKMKARRDSASLVLYEDKAVAARKSNKTLGTIKWFAGRVFRCFDTGAVIDTERFKDTGAVLGGFELLNMEASHRGQEFADRIMEPVEIKSHYNKEKRRKSHAHK